MLAFGCYDCGHTLSTIHAFNAIGNSNTGCTAWLESTPQMVYAWYVGATANALQTRQTQEPQRHDAPRHIHGQHPTSYILGRHRVGRRRPPSKAQSCARHMPKHPPYTTIGPPISTLYLICVILNWQRQLSDHCFSSRNDVYLPCMLPRTASTAKAPTLVLQFRCGPR